jgi:NAD(P)-dependent dehydrogenase (short-subunit alcohol dehydrogenase family)
VFAGALAAAGASLVLTGRDEWALGQAAVQLAGAADTGSVTVFPADVTDPRAMTAAVAHAHAVHGRVDVLINNAGIGGPLGPLWETDDDAWWQAMETCLHGTIRACRAALPIMIGQSAGRIINIVSSAGFARWPHASAYSTSKAAVIKLGENLAAEVRPHNITVLSYYPGLCDIGMTHDHLARGITGDPWTDRVGEWLRAERAAGRFTPSADAAAGLIQLASGQADSRSGEYITVDDVLAAARSDHSARHRNVGSAVGESPFPPTTP